MNAAICAYGAGNVRSVEVALRRLGVEAELAEDPAAVLEADLTVLPGVGAAGSAMHGLRARGLDDALRRRAAMDKPILGICLGLQLALDESEEDGGVAGLGLVPGRAVRLQPGWRRHATPRGDATPGGDNVATPRHLDGRVPRIGWAPVEPWGETYWFAHSYAAESEAAVATSEGIVAAVRCGSFIGVQFHPEKSGAAGARFLESCLCRA